MSDASILEIACGTFLILWLFYVLCVFIVMLHDIVEESEKGA